VLTGQTPAALDARLAAVLPLPQPAETLALTLPADTLRQRPDVQAAEAAVQAAAARIDQAQAARLPSFALSGSLGLSALSLGGSTTALAALLGSVSAPLWDGGAGAATVNVRQAQLTQAQEAWRASVLTALQDSEDALVALRQDRERVTYLKSASTAANSAALLARQRYASGLIDFQTVLQTQRTALSTQDSLASAQASVSADHVRLYKALGGGWTPTAQ
jgi:outer membrane protein TolC